MNIDFIINRFYNYFNIYNSLSLKSFFGFYFYSVNNNSKKKFKLN